MSLPPAGPNEDTRGPVESGPVLSPLVTGDSYPDSRAQPLGAARSFPDYEKLRHPVPAKTTSTYPAYVRDPLSALGLLLIGCYDAMR